MKKIPKILVVGSYMMDLVAQWARQAGVPVMLNPAPAAPLSDRLLSCVTYLSPNEHEAAEMAGRPLPTQNGVRDEDLQAVAAFCTALTGGNDPRQALTFASHTAALTVSRVGAMPSLLTLAEVEQMMEERNA